MDSICGLDEAGRGALAGPLVLVAVVLPTNFSFLDLESKVIIRDSKKLSRAQRLSAYEVIQKLSLKIDVEVIPVDLINQNGIQWANEEGFKRLIGRNDASKYIIDGKWKPKDLNGKDQAVNCLVGADATIPAAIASGIIAKVTRDKIMFLLHNEFDKYGWNTNCGYGTLKHIQAIKDFGACCHHRDVFVKTALKNHERFQV